MDFNTLMKKIKKEITNQYGTDFIKEAKKEQKVSYLHHSTKIASKEWIDKKKKEGKCTTGADYQGKLRKGWKYNKNKQQIENKTPYAAVIINKKFIKRIHKKITK